MFLTMLGRSALSYLASKISTTHLLALHVLSGSWAKLELNFSALEMLDLSCRLLMFLMGKRMSSMVMVLSFKSNTAPISCKVVVGQLYFIQYKGIFGTPNKVQCYACEEVIPLRLDFQRDKVKIHHVIASMQDCWF